MKKCTKCKEIKDDSAFAKRTMKTKVGLQPWCKECSNKNRSKTYKEDSVREQEVHKKRRYAIRKWFDEYKRNFGCKICDEKEAVCLDCHHKNPDEKDFNLGDIARKGWAKERIIKEVEKCVILCANCHRKLHAGLIEL